MRGSMLSCTACRVSEKAPEMTAWLAITVAAVASPTIGTSAQPGSISKNGLSGSAAMRKHERALPEIVEQQARKHDGQPGQHDRLAPEMAEVDIERFGAGDGQEDRADRDEGHVG